MSDQWASPPADFHYILFERINSAKNESRFYNLAWQRDLLGEWAVVRVYGRRGGRQRMLAAPFASLVEAWPTIRVHIRTRLRHGYRVVKPVEYQATLEKAQQANRRRSKTHKPAGDEK